MWLDERDGESALDDDELAPAQSHHACSRSSGTEAHQPDELLDDDRLVPLPTRRKARFDSPGPTGPNVGRRGPGIRRTPRGVRPPRAQGRRLTTSPPRPTAKSVPSGAVSQPRNTRKSIGSSVQAAPS